MTGEAKRWAKRAYLRAAVHGDPLAIRALGPSRLAVWRHLARLGKHACSVLVG